VSPQLRKKLPELSGLNTKARDRNNRGEGAFSTETGIICAPRAVDRREILRASCISRKKNGMNGEIKEGSQGTEAADSALELACPRPRNSQGEGKGGADSPRVLSRKPEALIKVAVRKNCDRGI